MKSSQNYAKPTWVPQVEVGEPHFEKPLFPKVCCWGTASSSRYVLASRGCHYTIAAPVQGT
ncbi:hypothetical protein C8R31_103340 [Nitrosospira sp. Nsp2]|nr:hypothetical protein C8R31_103340 [Nitrosospira sp. Nsp2]